MMFVQESKDLINDLLCGIIGEEPSEIHAIRDVLDGVKSVQCIDAAKDPGLADDAAFFNSSQRVLQAAGTDEIQSLCDSMELAGQPAIVNDSFIRFRNQR